MSQSSGRLQALDALRGIAALAVVLFHYIPYYDKLFGHDFSPWHGLDFGRYGVHLFFMLSGFVIFMTLERTRSAGWFGLARAFRLLPALWVGIALTFIVVNLIGPETRAVSFGAALLNMTLLHEYMGVAHVDGAYWSLVIEATFYMWMALLFYSVGRWERLRVIFGVWVLLSYAAVIWWQAIPEGLDFLIKDLLFARYAPLFVSGMLIYRWYRHGRPAPVDLALLAVAMAHCLFAYKTPYNLFVLGCYGVFVLAVTGRLEILAKRPLLWLGGLSYSLYLVHQNIGYGVINWSYSIGLPGWAGVMLALTAAFGLACGIHYGVEQPALRWFRHLRKQSGGKTPIPVAASERPCSS